MDNEENPPNPNDEGISSEDYWEVFIPASTQESDILIYELNRLGFTGFVEETNGVKAFIEKANFRSKAFYEALAFYTQVNPEDIIYKTIPPQNWNEVWEASFEPQIIDDTVLIKAPFHELNRQYPYEVIIEPQMAFGTGHHATTAMMVRLQLMLDFTDKQVFDFGTGSGVLAILAEKKGASDIYANDIKEDALRNLRGNIALNNCEKITLSQKDFPEFPPDIPFDIILANITRNTILDNLVQMDNILIPRGYILVSGFLKEDEPFIEKAFNDKNYQFHKSFHEDKWVASLFQKP